MKALKVNLKYTKESQDLIMKLLSFSDLTTIAAYGLDCRNYFPTDETSNRLENANPQYKSRLLQNSNRDFDSCPS